MNMVVIANVFKEETSWLIFQGQGRRGCIQGWAGWPLRFLPTLRLDTNIHVYDSSALMIARMSDPDTHRWSGEVPWVLLVELRRAHYLICEPIPAHDLGWLAFYLLYVHPKFVNTMNSTDSCFLRKQSTLTYIICALFAFFLQKLKTYWLETNILK